MPDRLDPAACGSETKLGPSPTPDLDAPTSDLDPVFPITDIGTRAVLYGISADEIQAAWTLRSNDLARFGSGFPIDGGRPTPVLRLRRFRPDGGCELQEEVRLRLSGVGGAGETRFKIGCDYVPFDAELGLINRDGGWLLLTRSNRLQHAAGIGLSFAHAAGERVRSDAPDPRLDPPGVALAPEFPLARLLPDSSILADLDPVSIFSRHAVVGLMFDGQAKASDGTLGFDQPASIGAADARDLNAAASPVADGRNDPGDAPSYLNNHMGREDSLWNATLAPVRIPTLDYRVSIHREPTLVIEAELRVSGWAEPNTDIDLFGHRYRVGPGGRFQFTVSVDDPALLRQALASHPPPELRYPRED